MITFTELGHLGQLGNQLFQFSALYSISKYLKEPIFIPEENIYTVSHKNEIWQSSLDLYNCFDFPQNYIVGKERINPEKIYSDTGKYEDSFWDITPNTSLHGYFQCEKYFHTVKEDLLKLYTFKPTIQKISKNFLIDIKKNSLETVSIHVRRRDFIGNCIDCKKEYYLRAIELIKTKGNYNLIFISDDIKWCESEFKNIHNNVFFTNSFSHYVDLCVISMCDHNIICNSSFGWWGSYLNRNPNKIIISPSMWYPPTDTLGRTNLEIFSPNWILL